MPKISSKSSSEFASTGARLSTKNAWAYYVRRRWKDGNGIKLAMREWDLTEGEAKGLWAAQPSQPTIDKVLDHPLGGFGLGLTILEIRMSTRLLDFLEHERNRLENDARRASSDAAVLSQMASRLPGLGRLVSMRGNGEGLRSHG
jgi:hypothetical protein